MSQSQEESPISDKMDISETTGSQQSPNSSDFDDALDNAESINPSAELCNLDNADVLRFTNSPRTGLTLTSSHPLMSPIDSSPISSNRNISYPDLIPESNPLRLGSSTRDVKQSSVNSNVTDNHQIKSCLSSSNSEKHQLKRPVLSKPLMFSQETRQQIDDGGPVVTPTLETYTDELPDFPESPSQLRRIPHIQLPQELGPEMDPSSGSEPDLSMYQTELAPSFQAVALHTHATPSPRSPRRRKIKVLEDPLPIQQEDTSSLDSLSDHSLDLRETLGSSNDSLASGVPASPSGNRSRTPPISEPLPEYTAAEERRDSRGWQTVTLPDGCVREIDMKVIEPYKRVLSHGGYLQAGGHNAIVVFGACFLPDKSRIDYNYVMDNLFLYVVRTLEQLVTEDYVFIYLHGSASRGNIPPFPWLRRCYQLLDRRLRKSLKQLYLVHPTFWLKSVVWMSRPFISSKFWKKLVYVNSLEELYTLVPVEKAAVPEKVKKYDSTLA